MKMTTLSGRARSAGVPLPSELTLATIASLGQAQAKRIIGRAAAKAWASHPISEIEEEIHQVLERSPISKLPPLLRRAARAAATYPLSDVERGVRETLEKSAVVKRSRRVSRATAAALAALPLSDIEGHVRQALHQSAQAKSSRSRLLSKIYSRRRWVLVMVAFYLVATVVARRRGYSGLGGRTLVRCRSGHLFRTIWVPGLSVKSLRLGWYRAQYCPVGRHWTVVKPVKDAQLSDEERALSPVPVDISIP